MGRVRIRSDKGTLRSQACFDQSETPLHTAPADLCVRRNAGLVGHLGQPPLGFGGSGAKSGRSPSRRDRKRAGMTSVRLLAILGVPLIGKLVSRNTAAHTPAGPSRQGGYGGSERPAAFRPAATLVLGRVAAAFRPFRGSIAQSDTCGPCFAGWITPPPRRTRFRGLARLCRTGDVPLPGPYERSTMPYNIASPAPGCPLHGPVKAKK